MSFSESEIKEILRYYDIGSFIKFNGKLEDGFQSENLLILTDKGVWLYYRYYTLMNPKLSGYNNI